MNPLPFDEPPRSNRFWSERAQRWLPRYIEVYTIQLWKHRRLQRTDINFIDVTWKSGIRFFAPTPEILFPYKAGDITEKDYIFAYREVTWNRFKKDPNFWLDLICCTPFALGCYCADDKFCHRYLLLDILRNICRRYGIELYFCGEIQ